MRVGIYGIFGLYNYGCEAIVRGAYRVIKSVDPHISVSYYSMQAAEDRVILSDIDIDVVQLHDNRILPVRVANVLAMRMNVPYRIGKSSYRQITDGSDVIFSVGGDIYTIPAYFRENKRYPYYNNIIQFGKYAIRQGKKIVVFGASIGPFGDYHMARNYYLKHLREVSLIVAREQRCIDYLNNESISDNVCFMPDPAFAVSIDSVDDANAGYIGINFSPLSFKEVYGTITDDIVSKVARQIENIYQSTHAQIMLIPHVVSPTSEDDNDYLFMKKIYENLANAVKEKVTISQPTNFLLTKKLLRKCRLIISARMHCAINAVCEGIPTIFLAYSEKAKGMANYIYGNDDYCLSLRSFEDDLLPSVSRVLERESEIHEYLIDRVEEIRKSMFQDEAIERIAKVLDEDGAESISK